MGELDNMQVIRLAVIISAKTNVKGMTVKKTLSKKQRFFNKMNLTTDDEVYIGIEYPQPAIGMVANVINNTTSTLSPGARHKKTK